MRSTASAGSPPDVPGWSSAPGCSSRVLVVTAAGSLGRELGDSFEVPGLDSQEAADLLSRTESDRAGLTAQVVVTPLDDGVTFFDSVEARDDLAEVEARVAALDNVVGISEPAEEIAAGAGEAAASGSVSPDGRIALIRVQYPVIEELDASDLANLKELGVELREGSSLQVEMGGDLFFAFEEAETGTGEVIGVIVAVIILLVAFGSFIAMGLPIGMTLFGLALGISSMSLITYLIDIPSWAPQMASMIGLGVGIDYALFLVTRHREFLARGATVEESVGRAVATAGLAVIFAGGTVVIAILGLAVAGVPFMTAAGVATAVIVLIMVVASVTLLPAFLGLAGRRISRVRFRRHRATRLRRRGRVALASMGSARHPAPVGVRRRRHRRPPRARRSGARPPPRDPGRGLAAPVADGTPGLRPGRRRASGRASTARW